MHQELPAPLRIARIGAGGRLVGRDMQFLEPEFTAMDRRKSIAEIGAAVSKTLDLGTRDHQAGFEGVDDLVLEAPASIRRHETFAVGVDRSASCSMHRSAALTAMATMPFRSLLNTTRRWVVEVEL